MGLSKKMLAAITVLALGGVGIGAAWAQDKDKIVADRQETMKQQGREMVAVRNYFQGKGEEAAATASKACGDRTGTPPPQTITGHDGKGEP